MSNTKIVEDYLNAFGNRDPETARGLLAKDFSFKGPMQQHDGADNFITAVSGFLPMIEGIYIHKMVEDGENVMAVYDFKTNVPAIGTTPTAEWFKIKNNKIISSKLFFDATEYRKIM